MKKSIIRSYFSHPKSTFNTEKEFQFKNYLKKHFSDLICPNTDIGYMGAGTPAYLRLVQWSNIVFVMESENETIGSGTHKEITTANENDIPVYVMRKKNGTYHFFEFNGFRFPVVKNSKQFCIL